MLPRPVNQSRKRRDRMSTTVILFDLDGTLIDTNHLICTTFQHTFRSELGLEIPDDVIRSYFGEPLTATFARDGFARRSADGVVDVAHVDQLVNAYRKFNLEQHDLLVREIAGIKNLVASLHSLGFKLAIVTSKKCSVAQMGLAACGLAEFFDVLVGMDTVTQHKPHGAPALYALQLLQESPGQHVLMVGDAPVDIYCGHNAGIRTCAVGWTSLARAALEEAKPHHWAETPADLLDIILAKHNLEEAATTG